MASEGNVTKYIDVASSSHDVPPHLRRNERLDVDSKGQQKRRLDPKAIVSLPQNSPNWYMPPKGIVSSDIFYPIQPDAEVQQTSFVIFGSQAPVAQRRFVKRHLHRFFQQQPVDLTAQDGHRRSAIFPLGGGGGGGQEDHMQNFTLYATHEGKVTVTMESVADRPELRPKEGQLSFSTFQSSDPYDLLLQKYLPEENEEEFPLYGESGDEGYFDEETIREIEEEEEELAAVQAKSRYLTPAEVNFIIEQCINDYGETWKSDHLPYHAHKAHNIWLDAQKKRIRNSLVKSYLADNELLESRLRKLRRQLHLNQYTKASELHTQCQSMEQTVHTIESQKWRISVLEASQCPPKPVSKPLKRPKKVKPRPSDDESIGSDTDVDSLGDFIDDDMFIAGQNSKFKKTATVDISHHGFSEDAMDATVQSLTLTKATTVNHSLGEPTDEDMVDATQSLSINENAGNPENNESLTVDNSLGDFTDSHRLATEQGPEIKNSTTTGDLLESPTVNHTAAAGESPEIGQMANATSGLIESMGWSLLHTDDESSDDSGHAWEKRLKRSEEDFRIARDNDKNAPSLSSSHSQSVPPQSSSSPFVTVGGKSIELIDLTNSPGVATDEDEEWLPLDRTALIHEAVTTPSKSGSSTLSFVPAGPVVPKRHDSIDGEVSSTLHRVNLVDELKRVGNEKWADIEKSGDRKKLLAKVIASLGSDERQRMSLRLPTYHEDRLKGLTFDALYALKRHKLKVRSFDQEENDFFMRVAVFYISWKTCLKQSEKGIKKVNIENALASIHDSFTDPKTSFQTFAQNLSECLAAFDIVQREERSPKTDRSREVKQRQEHSSEAHGSREVWQRQAHSSEADGDLDRNQRHEHPSTGELARTPHKKRKRQVKESQAVKSGHMAAQQRVVMQENQRQLLEKRMESIGMSNNDPERQAVSFGNPVIYLDPHIGRRVKPHQLSGLQFMWRELIQDDKSEGCLLAHTMGLGKTMQVVSLLVTIAAAAKSPDPSVRNQIPARLIRSQTLILCPSSLIDNWYEEFLMWTPRENALGQIRMVTASLSMRQRVAETESWAEAGGILILSYDLFRRWMQLDEKQSTHNSLDHKTLEKVQGHLLNGPSIVVADEAHKMKNTASKLALAAAEFKSKSRIALTGSPLANNLRDYFAMVNWIAPGYLGNEVAFRANYIEPIEEGLYVESTHHERRRSLKKLQVLKEILDPKINRADISVLKGSLPPKVEFVMTVPLTELQKTAYNNYVRLLLTEKSADVHMATLWAWLGTLGLCCNHPSCFYEKLLNQTKKARQRSEVADEEKQSLIEKSLNDESNELDDDKLLEDTPISSPGLNEVMYNSQEQAFLDVSDLEDPKHSYRSEIFLRIVEESVKAGDKVLCFSHSIPTLNYLEALLKQFGKQYCRLDGTTPVSSRQKATKEFNRHASLEVYLISTRAGGLGLNIFGANRVIIFDFGFNPTWEEQAVARAYRLGQTKPVFVYRFLAGGTFEEIIHNKSVFKSQLAMRVVDKKNVVRWASKSLGDYLFPVKEVKTEDISGFMGKDVHVLDKIIQDDHGSIIRKIALTETFSMEDHDRLTEEERKDVEQELDLERLKRSDPVAYDQRMRAMQLSATTTISTAMPVRMAFPTNQSYHTNQQPH